jgi:hypothetical protein
MKTPKQSVGRKKAQKTQSVLSILRIFAAITSTVSSARDRCRYRSG